MALSGWWVNEPFFCPISAGAYHSAIIDCNGAVMTWGNNTYTQLGIGAVGEYTSTPQIIPLPVVAKQLSCGGYFTTVLDPNGCLWLWGKNSEHQVSGVVCPTVPFPTMLQFSVRFTSVACGYASTIALDENGKCWSWGSNEYGQLGVREDKAKVSAPTQISDLPHISSIGCGYFHTMAIDKESKVWSWGNNEHGQLGATQFTTSRLPVLLPDVKAKFVTGGSYHSLMIDLHDHLWAWGWNSLGQVGNGQRNDQRTPTPIIPSHTFIYISCGYSHSVALSTEGTFWGWGGNENGELAVCPDSQEVLPVPERIIENQSLEFICAGGGHTFLANAEGRLTACGWNEDGQIGVEDTSDGYSSEFINIPGVKVMHKYVLRAGRTKSARR